MRPCGARLPRRDHAGGVPYASRHRSLSQPGRRYLFYGWDYHADIFMVSATGEGWRPIEAAGEDRVAEHTRVAGVTASA